MDNNADVMVIAIVVVDNGNDNGDDNGDDNDDDNGDDNGNDNGDDDLYLHYYISAFLEITAGEKNWMLSKSFTRITSLASYSHRKGNNVVKNIK